MRLLESGQLLSIGANDGHCRSWKEANLPQDVDKLPHSSAPPNKLLTSIASFDKCWKTIGIPSKQWLPNPKVIRKPSSSIVALNHSKNGDVCSQIIQNWKW